MTHVGYLVAGYGLTTAVLVGYVLRLRWRTRALSRLAAASSERARPAETATVASGPVTFPPSPTPAPPAPTSGAGHTP